LNITDDGCAYCIKADYYKMGYANFMNHTKDGFKATGIKVIDMNNNEDIKPKVVGKLKYNSNFDCGARIYDVDGIAPTQQTITGGNLETKIVDTNEQNFRIRKLTPREVFRVMDVEEKDIDTLLNTSISNSQLFKLAGNSICCGVLYHIFRKMFIETDMDNTGKPQQLSLF